MLRKRISVVAVGKFAAAVLSVLALVVLCVSCDGKPDYGEYLGKSGNEASCERMAEGAGCESARDASKYLHSYFVSASHECYCRLP